LCHVFERIAGHFGGIKKGITAYYVQDFNTIVEDIQTKKPTLSLPCRGSVRKGHHRQHLPCRRAVGETPLHNLSKANGGLSQG
jgi:hypothetical protein